MIYSDNNNDKAKFSVDINGELKLKKARGKLRDFDNTNFI